MRITPGMKKAIKLLHENPHDDATVVSGPTCKSRFGPEINAGVAARLDAAGLLERHEWADGTVTIGLDHGDIDVQSLVAEVLDLALCLVCNLPSDESPYCEECWREMRP